jgi:hypothetical protein
MVKEDKSKSIAKANRKEVWMRIPLGIVSGAIIWVWAYLICLFFVINFFYGIFTGKKIDDLSEMSEVWNTQKYFFVKYMTFVSTKRPFPFTKLEKSISKVE